MAQVVVSIIQSKMMSWLFLQCMAAVAMTSLAACLVTEENEIKWASGRKKTRTSG